MFENGFDPLGDAKKSPVLTQSVLRYLVLDCRADETILSVDTVRCIGGEQRGSKDNREITYGHRVLRFVLHDPEKGKKKGYLAQVRPVIRSFSFGGATPV
jgi:hypothetical protein